MSFDERDLCQCPRKIGPHFKTDECRKQEADLERFTAAFACSSFGSPDATAARNSVTPSDAARVAGRAARISSRKSDEAGESRG